MIAQICEESKCTGCLACMNLCPCGAITCQEREDGNVIPQIDPEKCIECHRCVQGCPENHVKEKHEPRQCYASWQKDRKERKYSASGGIAFGFYKRWIQNAGIVYGAAFNEKGILTQQKAETLEEARKFRGSKYVQSYNGFSYSEIGKELKKGKKVLFIGTPCQIAGLKAYLGKASEALVTIDLICHGTPPMSYLEEYIKEIAGAEKVDRVSFRGEKDYHMVFYSQDRVVYSQRFRKDLYYTAYLQGIIHRENCYKCEYADKRRVSDLTIGDFWGIDRKSLKVPYKGKISVVLVNSEKGRKFWDLVKDEFIYEERSLEEAVKGNVPLQRPAALPKDRMKFIEVYKEKGFMSAVKTPGVQKAIEEAKVKDNLFYRILGKIKRRFR